MAFPLTVLVILGVLASAGGFPGHTFYFVQTLRQRRQLLGAGYFGIEVLAPIIGVLCVTGEYRHKTITTTLVLTPVRTRVLARQSGRDRPVVPSSSRCSPSSPSPSWPCPGTPPWAA